MFFTLRLDLGHKIYWLWDHSAVWKYINSNLRLVAVISASFGCSHWGVFVWSKPRTFICFPSISSLLHILDRCLDRSLLAKDYSIKIFRLLFIFAQSGRMFIFGNNLHLWAVDPWTSLYGVWVWYICWICTTNTDKYGWTLVSLQGFHFILSLNSNLEC